MQAKLILALVLSILWFAAGWTISSWYNNAGYAKTLQAALEQQKQDLKKANQASIELERTRIATEAKSKESAKKAQVYLKGKPESECFDKEALDIFNDV